MLENPLYIYIYIYGDFTGKISCKSVNDVCSSATFESRVCLSKPRAWKSESRCSLGQAKAIGSKGQQPRPGGDGGVQKELESWRYGWNFMGFHELSWDLSGFQRIKKLTNRQIRALWFFSCHSWLDNARTKWMLCQFTRGYSVRIGFSE